MSDPRYHEQERGNHRHPEQHGYRIPETYQSPNAGIIFITISSFVFINHIRHAFFTKSSTYHSRRGSKVLSILLDRSLTSSNYFSAEETLGVRNSNLESE